MVLAVSLDVRAGTGQTWSGRYLLDLRGTTQESAMARCVSRPLALVVRHTMTGSLPPGLNRAAGTPASSAQCLGEQAADGLEFTLRTES